VVQDGHGRQAIAQHMRIVIPTDEQNEALKDMIRQKLGNGLVDSQCFAVMDNELVVGVLSWFNYRWPNIEVGFYCDNAYWGLASREIVKAFAYPFNQLQCKRVTALVEKKNPRMRRMCALLGFQEEGKLRKAGPKGDIIVYGLLPEELRLRHGFKSKTASAA